MKFPSKLLNRFLGKSKKPEMSISSPTVTSVSPGLAKRIAGASPGTTRPRNQIYIQALRREAAVNTVKLYDNVVSHYENVISDVHEVEFYQSEVSRLEAQIAGHPGNTDLHKPSLETFRPDMSK